MSKGRADSAGWEVWYVRELCPKTPFLKSLNRSKHVFFSKNSFSQIANKFSNRSKHVFLFKKLLFSNRQQILKSLKTRVFSKKLLFLKSLNHSKHFIFPKNSFSQITNKFSNHWKFTKTEENLKVVAFKNCSNLSYFHCFSVFLLKWVLL